MRFLIRVSIRVYATLLRLYPSGFRVAFEEEMRAVFAEAMTENKAILILIFPPSNAVQVPSDLAGDWLLPLNYVAQMAIQFVAVQCRHGDDDVVALTGLRSTSWTV